MADIRNFTGRLLVVFRSVEDPLGALMYSQGRAYVETIRRPSGTIAGYPVTTEVLGVVRCMPARMPGTYYVVTPAVFDRLVAAGRDDVLRPGPERAVGDLVLGVEGFVCAAGSDGVPAVVFGAGSGPQEQPPAMAQARHGGAL